MSEAEDWRGIYYRVFPEEQGAWPKAEILHGLAEAAEGPIVEVGAGQGRGTVALALGARHLVFAVDAFAETRGWANERYGPELEDKWLAAVEAAGVESEVVLVKQDVGDLARNRMIAPGVPLPPAGLTFWDLGQRIAGDVAEWLEVWCRSCVAPGGIVAINETGGGDLGVDRWLYDHGDLLRLLRVEAGYIRVCRHG